MSFGGLDWFQGKRKKDTPLQWADLDPVRAHYCDEIVRTSVARDAYRTFIGRNLSGGVKMLMANNPNTCISSALQATLDIDFVACCSDAWLWDITRGVVPYRIVKDNITGVKKTFCG